MNPRIGILFFTLFPLSLFALEVNKNLSVDVSLTAVYQYADFSKDVSGNVGKGSVATDIGLNFHPTDVDQIQLTFSFADGNGLKKTFSKKDFLFMPNADDLEDDLKNINGRNRDYLLEAWYRHTLTGRDFNLSFTGGIIDATAYIDDNAFANDETTQFMNDVFVNDPLASLPSYDLGGVVEFERENLTLKALAINSKTDSGKNYTYYAGQITYSQKNPLGEGNYRVFYFTTSKAFEKQNGDYDRLEGIGISVDQTVNKSIGLFARVGINTHTSTGDLKNFYSAGAVIKELPLNGRVGIGAAYSLGNKKISSLKDAKTGEIYYEFPLWEGDITFDLQWDREKFETQTLEATTFGVRFTVAF